MAQQFYPQAFPPPHQQQGQSFGQQPPQQMNGGFPAPRPPSVGQPRYPPPQQSLQGHQPTHQQQGHSFGQQPPQQMNSDFPAPRPPLVGQPLYPAMQQSLQGHQPPHQQQGQSFGQQPPQQMNDGFPAPLPPSVEQPWYPPQQQSLQGHQPQHQQQGQSFGQQPPQQMNGDFSAPRPPLVGQPRYAPPKQSLQDPQPPMQPGMMGPRYPQQPGQQQQQQPGPLGQPYYQGQHQQQQRLDPDAMPSVVQVVEDDRNKFNNNSNVLFQTTIPASVPPLITTIGFDGKSLVEDGGTARPNHLRCSVYQVPTSEDILKMTSIPLCLTTKPFDEEEIDGHMNVPISPSEIVRCNRCKAYMNSFMRFIDGGRRFQCSLCRHITETPQMYLAHLDHTGQRLDKFDRPELYLGSYEFKATTEFCRNQVLNCRRPHIVFAFELTVNSRPIIQQISKELPNILRTNLPSDVLRPGSLSPMVGFMTYNSKIQMYDIVNNGHAHVICDVASPFPPITTFLVDPVQYADQIDNFLASLPDLYADDELDTETVLGPVIEAALQTCQVDISNWYTNIENDLPQQGQNNSSHPTPKDPSQSVAVGKVYLFHCTLPTYGQDGVTPGRLKPRWTTSPDEIRKLLGTDKEKQILAPEASKYYSNLAQKCVSDYGSGVELFLFPPVNGSFLDIASISELVRLTGSGGVYKYYNEISNRFLTDLKYSLTSSFGFDAIMKVRTSTGIRAYEYVGNFYARTTSDIEIATVNAGSSIAIELRYDDKLSEDDFVVIQIATLYTSVSGERRVRIHNTALSVCQQVADVYRNACCDTLMNLLLRQSVAQLRLGEKTVQQIRENLISKTVAILAAYRKHCAQPGSSLGQLILPEALKLLPVYVTGALKCDAIDGGPEMMPDDKAYAQIRAISADLRGTQVTLYPKVLKIEYEENKESLRAVNIRDSAMRLANQTGLCYVMENGFYLFIYIPTQPAVEGQNQFFKNVFGVDTVHQIQPESGVPELLTQESQFIQGLLNGTMLERRKALKVYIVRQGMDPVESVFRSFLYEDTKTHVAVSESGKHEVPSYVDLLCHLHKEIRAQLN